MGRILQRFVFCTCMIALAYSSAYCRPYSDLRPEHWAYKALKNFKEKGIIKFKFDKPVYQDIYLSGTKPITRYEATVIIAMLFKERLPKQCFRPTDLRQLSHIQILLPQYLSENPKNLIPSSVFLYIYYRVK